jgi:hypothetical protein
MINKRMEEDQAYLNSNQIRGIRHSSTAEYHKYHRPQFKSNTETHH